MNILLGRTTFLRRCGKFMFSRKQISFNTNKNNNNNNPKPGSPFKTYLQLFCGAGLFGAIGSAIATVSKSFLSNNQKKNTKSIVPKVDADDTNNLREKFNFINKIVEKCAPAVVYVEIKDPKRIDKGTDDALIVSNGSGFLIREDGWILTNAHVVVNKPNAIVQVKLFDGTSYSATVEDADMNTDLALIKISCNRRLPSLSMGKTGDVNVGEWVVALGSPLSLTHSATAGVVSCVNRAANELGLPNYQMKYIQTDAPITFGNSGGPLVNLDGDVIGVNNLRITAGISFAIPIDYASKFLDRIKFATYDTKKPDDGPLGLTVISVTPDILSDLIARHKGISDLSHGVLIWKVLHNSFANKNGLQTGDIITHINGNDIHKASDVYQFFADRNATYKLDIMRNGEKLNIIIKHKD